MSNFILISNLEKYRNLLAETEELETLIKPQGSFPLTPETAKKRTFIRYFWPYLVAAVGGFYVVYMITVMIVMSSVPRTGTASAAQSQMLVGDLFAGIISGFIVALILVFFGISISKKKQAAFNSQAEYLSRELTERYNQGLANQRAINLLHEDVQRMRQYEPLVPDGYRTSEKVGAIIEILRTEKAETVEEACAML